MQLPQVHLRLDPEGFYDDRGPVKCSLVYVSETTSGKNSSFAFERCRRQHKRGREHVKGGTQLSEIPQVSFASLCVEIDFFEDLSS